MNKFVLIGLAVLGPACSGSAGMAQSGEHPERRTYALAGFDGVSVVGPHRVVVSVGPAFSVSAEGPARTLERTEVLVEDGRLKIHPVRDDDWRREDWEDYEAATFRVTLPRLGRTSLVGSGTMSVDEVTGERFSASLAGSGLVDIASLRTNEAKLSIAGSGELLARGGVQRAQVSIAGSGQLRARDLSSEEASVSVAGSGDAELTVRRDARVSVVGGGDVEIAGSARCTVSRIGGGEVRCAEIERETEFSLR